MSLKILLPMLFCLFFTLPAEEVSEKEKCTITFRCEKPLDEKGKAEYSFTIKNHQDRLVPFLFSHIQVTDQEGREVRVMKRKELIARVEADTHAKLMDLHFQDPDNKERKAEIQNARDKDIAQLEKVVFESTAIEPSGEYTAHFTVKISDRILKDLEGLFFSFRFDGGDHRFTTECHHVKRR